MGVAVLLAAGTILKPRRAGPRPLGPPLFYLIAAAVFALWAWTDLRSARKEPDAERRARTERRLATWCLFSILSLAMWVISLFLPRDS